MLNLSRLALRRGPRLLLEDTSLQIHPGQKVGLTGANGTGKSSLFAMILGEIGPDSGDLTVPSDWVIAHVAQQTPNDVRAAIEFVLDGDAELREVEKEMARTERDGNGEALAELHGRYEAIGGYAARSRAGQLMHGLGFTNGDEDRPVNQFSGGWRVRLNLAQALMCRSDLLLLDEPTNHLDLDAVIWLERWLRSYEGTLLLISHDRDFLDACVNHIVNIEQGSATLYTGNYSDFEQVRAARLALRQAEYEKQQREIAHMRSFVDRFRAKASKARQAQSRLKAIERMQLIAPAHVDSPFRFRLLEPERLPRPLLRLDDVAVGYGKTTVLSGLQASISPGDRIGLLGANGAGKSTFIKLLAGELEKQSGDVHAARDLRIGYFAQHQVEQLHPQHSPLEHLVQIDPAAPEADLRNWLGGFGFSGDTALAPTAPFSGGEKSRLALALIVYRRPNLLLLDEPTNHLDLEMRQALAVALQSFDGAMVIVSHDRHLLRVSTDALWLVNDGRAVEFDGGLDDYPAWLAGRDRDEAKRQGATDAERAAERKARKRKEAERRQSLAPLRREAKNCEREVETLHSEQQALEEKLADGDLYGEERAEELKRLMADQSQIRARLTDAEQRWLDACEALEKMEARAD